MLFQEKAGVRAIRWALSVLVGSVCSFAIAQDQVQKVEVTGSSIKRIMVEGASPVQTLSQEAIQRSGANSVAELMQALPAMQGFTIAAIAAGNNTGGRVSVSLHDIGEEYTLVLLNGRRLAPQGSGSAVNLNAIPLSAIEKIEILTDGASAIYGSDAIAGVVNFILKKSEHGGALEASYNAPSAGGGQAWNAGLSYGFGDASRYNVLLAYRHDQQNPVKATERDFAKTAYLPVNHAGAQYIYDRTSTATVPANVDVSFKNQLPTTSFSPYLKKNGNCPERNVISLNNSASVADCSFDFASTVEIVPQAQRDSFFGKFSFNLNQDWSAYADLALSRYDLTARIAPNTAPFAIATDSQYYRDNVLPFLSASQAAAVKTVTGNYRTYDWGTRDRQTITNTKHFVTGVEGEIDGWSLGAGLTWSQNALDERYVGGYALDRQFRAMLDQRAFDPFAPIGQQSASTRELIQSSLFHGSVRRESTTLSALDARGSRELFELDGGQASLGFGGDYRQYRYEQMPSQAAQDKQIYNLDAAPAYDLRRTSFGVFAELLAPVSKELEISAALRYDSISAIDNRIAQRTIGHRDAATTYKFSARYQPSRQILLRASYGTGFKAPSMLDLAQPLVSDGVTASAWPCPIPDSENCHPGKAQYHVLASGNENLKPETSKQFTLGFRYEPRAQFSIGADIWDVELKNAISSVSEQLAWDDVARYRSLFTTYTEAATGKTYWAFHRPVMNIGRKHHRGVDWDITSREKISAGILTLSISGTHMFFANYTLPGSADKWASSLNFFGSNDAVTARNLIRAGATLESGALTNTLTLNYRDGYVDALAKVRNVATGLDENIRLQVPSYTTLDWQARFDYTRQTAIRIGIKNVFNAKPPMSLRASSGHQVGFDPRYADPLLRSFYITANYRF